MSKLNIPRLVANIRQNTTVYTPLVEVIVNAIQAIDAAGQKNGRITIRVLRSAQIDVFGGLPEVTGFEVTDNGVGFDKPNRDSFDTLYGELKLTEGGKGFGRFTTLRYFDNLDIDSVFQENQVYKRRTFSLGKRNSILEREKIQETDQTQTGSQVRLIPLKKGKSIDKKLETLGRNIVEKLLPYFITADYVCPTIEIVEEDGSNSIVLNDYFSNQLKGVIREVSPPTDSFTLDSAEGQQTFRVRVFRIYFPRGQSSKISLVAHKREVTSTPLQQFVPEFAEDFYDQQTNGNSDAERNYIIKVYVFGVYLDDNVSLERGGFEFNSDTDVLLGISQQAIEAEAAKIAKETAGPEILLRQKRKLDQVFEYVDSEAPWNKNLVAEMDFSQMPMNPTEEQIEIKFQQEKFRRDQGMRRRVQQILNKEDFSDIQDDVAAVVAEVKDAGMNELVHYVALRRKILDILKKSLTRDERGQYRSEGLVHDIIFPRKRDSTSTSYGEHNLWLIDERLNFTSHIDSDRALDKDATDFPDLLIFNRPVIFRGENEATNPITIFEFKRPGRDDFVNPSSKEDPVKQIIRYINKIRAGKVTTPEGRRILVTNDTPYYGYIVCELTSKVEEWLKFEQDFRRMPDGLGWFSWNNNLNLYLEVLSWDKVVKDANMRNKVFFQMLGI